MVVKAWVSRTDPECTTEETTYQKLQCPSRDASIVGVPKILANGWDATCEVYAIVMQKLGPNLQDILEVSQFRKFDERMTMAVAIQMVNYLLFHVLGIAGLSFWEFHVSAKPLPRYPFARGHTQWY